MADAPSPGFGARLRHFAGRVVLVTLGTIGAYFALCAFLLFTYRVIDPPTTGVHLQRRIESWFAEGDYAKRYTPVDSAEQALTLRRAVVAAEDGRFYEHGGVDWEAVREAMEDNRRRGETWRGGSTITQQLAKNLFQTTHSSFVRKAFELPLTYLTEWILPKERQLTVYLNVIEFGDGIYGAEAAAQHHYGRSAARLSRYQSAALAAVIPSPRRRTPQRMGWYTDIILTRMRQMGW